MSYQQMDWLLVWKWGEDEYVTHLTSDPNRKLVTAHANQMIVHWTDKPQKDEKSGENNWAIVKLEPMKSGDMEAEFKRIMAANPDRPDLRLKKQLSNTSIQPITVLPISPVA